MRFYVILSVDIPKTEYINHYTPSRKIRRKMDLTETDDCYEFDYLEGDWTGGKHRKYCGFLNRSDFEELISDCELWAEDVETMGSLTGIGWLPAISFSSEHYSAIVNAYVTPMPEFEQTWNDRDQDFMWNRIKDVMVKMYG